jgi:hypothetical protein
LIFYLKERLIWNRETSFGPLKSPENQIPLIVDERTNDFSKASIEMKVVERSEENSASSATQTKDFND